jgi:hypothetical protein
MGAWSQSSFGNDDAMDFVGEFLEKANLSTIQSALTAAGGDEYLESPEACCAIAAAELLAAKLGKPSTDLPPDIPSVLGQVTVPSPADMALARRVVARIMDNSELAELWSEGGPTDVDWLNAMEDLLKRLA